MKRDMELIREILIEFEKIDETAKFSYEIQIENYTRKEIIGHVFMLYDGGFIDIVNASTQDGKDFLAKGLKWEGHNFLEVSRNENIWKRVTGKLYKEGMKVGSTILYDILTKETSKFVETLF